MDDYTATEAALKLGVSLNTIYDIFARDEMPGVYRIGTRGRYRIPEAALNAYKTRSPVTGGLSKQSRQNLNRKARA